MMRIMASKVDTGLLPGLWDVVPVVGVASTTRGLRRRLGHRLNAVNVSEVAAARGGSVHIDVTSPWGHYFTVGTLGDAQQLASQEAIKQVAIGHRVTQSMPQSFTERR
jgi:hypothetical protein